MKWNWWYFGIYILIGYVFSMHLMIRNRRTDEEKWDVYCALALLFLTITWPAIMFGLWITGTAKESRDEKRSILQEGREERDSNSL